MTIRQYFILAAERPYNPQTGEQITYRVELDASLGRHVRPPTSEAPSVHELTVHFKHVEHSLGPDSSRVEGFTGNPRTVLALGVFGPHKTRPLAGEQQSGLLQVSEDD
jgi:hypothetical protein